MPTSYKYRQWDKKWSVLLGVTWSISLVVLLSRCAMAAGFVMLRMDGEGLRKFINSQNLEEDMIAICMIINLPEGSLSDFVTKALQQLPVEYGMPPPTDPWVMSNIIEPALQTISDSAHEESPSGDTYLAQFKKVVENIISRLEEHPVTVAHTENTFDGTGIKRLLTNNFEFDKSLDAALKTLPKDRNGKISKEYLRMALDAVGSSAGLPPYGALEQMDKVVTDVFNMVNADDGKMVDEDEFKKLLTKILRRIMFQLQGSPITVSSNSVVHEPLASPSTRLPATSESHVGNFGTANEGNQKEKSS